QLNVQLVMFVSDHDLEDVEMQVVRYKPVALDLLCKNTKFTRKELQIMYRGFKQECPAGAVNEETFKKIYAQFFPQGDSSAYAHFVFNSFDHNKSGCINFEDFVTGLSILSRGTFQERLQWAFNLYDINKDGLITRDEMFDIISAIYDMMGRFSEPMVDDSTVQDHVNKVFQVDMKNDWNVPSSLFLFIVSLIGQLIGLSLKIDTSIYRNLLIENTNRFAMANRISVLIKK
ncbi:hypothetical protein FSP39_003067, partial [Pinctada imbricata]